MYKIPAGNEFSSCLVLGAGGAMQPSSWNLEVHDQSSQEPRTFAADKIAVLRAWRIPANHLQRVEIINDK